MGELTIKTPELRHSILQFQSLSFLKSRNEVQAAKVVISDYKHNTTGHAFSIIIHRESTVQFCPVEFLLHWCCVRESNSGPPFCLAEGSAVKMEVFTWQLKGVLDFCDLDCSSDKSHSFRFGAASLAAENGMSDMQIRGLGRKSNAFNCVGKLGSFSVIAVMGRLLRPNNEFSTGMSWRTAWCLQKVIGSRQAWAGEALFFVLLYRSKTRQRLAWCFSDVLRDIYFLLVLLGLFFLRLGFYVLFNAFWCNQLSVGMGWRADYPYPYIRTETHRMLAWFVLCLTGFRFLILKSAICFMCLVCVFGLRGVCQRVGCWRSLPPPNFFLS